MPSGKGDSRNPPMSASLCVLSVGSEKIEAREAGGAGGLETKEVRGTTTRAGNLGRAPFVRPGEKTSDGQIKDKREGSNFDKGLEATRLGLLMRGKGQSPRDDKLK